MYWFGIDRCEVNHTRYCGPHGSNVGKVPLGSDALFKLDDASVKSSRAGSTPSSEHLSKEAVPWSKAR